MATRYLADTHVVIRWITQPRKLSREQERILDRCEIQQEQIALSGISLLEMAMLVRGRNNRLEIEENDLFDRFDENPMFLALPLTSAIAREAAALASLRDPADRVIVATARVHRLTLLSSDQRIVTAGLVAVIE